VTYDEWKSTEPDPNEFESEPCGDCGGQGFFSVASDDDEMADKEYCCESCRGTGFSSEVKT
jgi:hypothetical protein